MSKIKNIVAREILDSRGKPTVEVRVFLQSGLSAKASVASGASTGEFEALELRDKDLSRFGGSGVLRACANVNDIISPSLQGQNVFQQDLIDQRLIELDGTTNKSKLGANAILGVSLAVARCAALLNQQELYNYLKFAYSLDVAIKNPVPMFNILNGGKHADSGLAIQEFMIVPLLFNSFNEQLRCGSEVFQSLKNNLTVKGYATGVGDEGGFAPQLGSIEEGFDLIMKSIQDAGYVAGKEVCIALDVAATSFYDTSTQKYTINPGNRVLDDYQLMALYMEWIKKYPIISIEDPLQENGWQMWNVFKNVLRSQSEGVLLVADDLTVTNVERLQEASQKDCANGIIIKLNQIGTVSETIRCIQEAQKLKWKTIVSHRSGETCDDFIADLAVAVKADFIKAGSLSRGERLAKYNRVAEIVDNGL